jgi:predicted metal-binding protein
MTRIGVITCTNCTQDANCAAVVCLADLRKRRGCFAEYPAEEPLDLIGLTSCAGCPTLAAPDKILKRARSLAEYRLDALHFSYCMTALCPFLSRYQRAIQEAYPELRIVHGTHEPLDVDEFRRGLHEILCPSLRVPQDVNELTRGTLEVPGDPIRF